VLKKEASIGVSEGRRRSGKNLKKPFSPYTSEQGGAGDVASRGRWVEVRVSKKAAREKHESSVSLGGGHGHREKKKNYGRGSSLR